MRFHAWCTSGDFASGSGDGACHRAGPCPGIVMSRPAGTTTYHDRYLDTDRPYDYSTWTSPVHVPGFGATRVVPSWNAQNPPGTWLKVELNAGIPVITSQAFDRGEIDGVDYPVNGHLWVVVGFTRAGGVMVHDPAAPSNAQVRHVHRRRQFETMWLRTSWTRVDGSTGRCVRWWLARHPRIQQVFIPKRACWLNLAEGWWRLLRRPALAGQSFADTAEIAYAVQTATAQLNTHAKPWIWGRPPPPTRELRRKFVYSL